MDIPIKSLLFLIGDEDFADSPALVNRKLFADPAAKWEPFMTRPSPRGDYKVEINPEFQHATMGTRLIVALKITRPDNSWFIQPFYRSSGRATPGKSPRGKWWPTSGLYTAAYCVWRGHHPNDEGYIGKHMWVASPTGGRWVAHHKEHDLLSKPYQEISDALAARIAPLPQG